MCKICFKLKIKTQERRHARRSDVFIVIFEQILHIVLVFPWKYNKTRNIISFSVSKTFFIFLMSPIDSTNDQNIYVELLKPIFTH